MQKERFLSLFAFSLPSFDIDFSALCNAWFLFIHGEEHHKKVRLLIPII